MSKTTGALIAATLLAGSLAAVPTVSASTLLLAEGPAGDAAFGGYGQPSFNIFTAAVDNVFVGSDLTVVPDFSNLSQVMAHDALWIDMRGSFDGTVLSATEQTNISTFIATGRRVVFFGENNAGWGAWNASLLSLVGGTSTTNSPSGVNHAASVLAHPLTAGLNSENGLSEVDFNSAGLANEGTPLFDINSATLWGPSLNVLTVLDMNVYFDSVIGSHPENGQFLGNIAAWLFESDGEPVPEPASLGLLGLGVAGLLGFARRRKR